MVGEEQAEFQRKGPAVAGLCQERIGNNGQIFVEKHGRCYRERVTLARSGFEFFYQLDESHWRSITGSIAETDYASIAAIAGVE